MIKQEYTMSKKKKKTDNYRKGRIAEKKVCNDLASKGFVNIRRSKGSRCPADIYTVNNGQKYYIQVSSGTANISLSEVRKLRELAKQRKGSAVSIQRSSGSNKWKFLDNWSKIKMKKLDVGGGK